jgi:hypothetical protein
MVSGSLGKAVLSVRVAITLSVCQVMLRVFYDFYGHN